MIVKKKCDRIVERYKFNLFRKGRERREGVRENQIEGENR